MGNIKIFEEFFRTKEEKRYHSKNNKARRKCHPLESIQDIIGAFVDNGERQKNGENERMEHS